MFQYDGAYSSGSEQGQSVRAANMKMNFRPPPPYKNNRVICFPDKEPISVSGNTHFEMWVGYSCSSASCVVLLNLLWPSSHFRIIIVLRAQ